MVQGRVEWVSNESALVPLEESNESLLQSWSVVEGHSVSIGLVLSVSGQVHGEELSHERDWAPQVLEDEQVEEVRFVREPEGEKDAFAAQGEGEGCEHYD